MSVLLIIQFSYLNKKIQKSNEPLPNNSIERKNKTIKKTNYKNYIELQKKN
jgi:hypothetical protein